MSNSSPVNSFSPKYITIRNLDIKAQILYQMPIMWVLRLSGGGNEKFLLEKENIGNILPIFSQKWQNVTHFDRQPADSPARLMSGGDSQTFPLCLEIGEIQ